jgi:hypothetical protein
VWLDGLVAGIESPSPEPVTVVEEFLSAYNAQDFDRCAELLADEVRVVHYNRPVDVSGRDAVLGSFRASTQGAFPDRRFLPARRRIVAGADVVVEHAWVATAAMDVPGFGGKGEEVRIELATIFTVRDGRIVLYAEYG